MKRHALLIGKPVLWVCFYIGFFSSLCLADQNDDSGFKSIDAARASGSKDTDTFAARWKNGSSSDETAPLNSNDPNKKDVFLSRWKKYDDKTEAHETASQFSNESPAPLTIVSSIGADINAPPSPKPGDSSPSPSGSGLMGSEVPGRWKKVYDDEGSDSGSSSSKGNEKPKRANEQTIELNNGQTVTGVVVEDDKESKGYWVDLGEGIKVIVHYDEIKWPRESGSQNNDQESP